MLVSDLLTKIRRQLDESSPAFWTDDELIDYVNEGYIHYWQWLIQAGHPAAISDPSTSLDIVDGVNEIALPLDFVKARLVERVMDSATIPMEFFERFDTSNRTSGVSTNSLLGYVPRYRFQGPSLVLEPTPCMSQTGGILLTYFYNPDRLTSGDTPSAPFDDLYSDLLVLYAIICAKEHEEMISPGTGGVDSAPFLGRLQRLEQKFKESIEPMSTQRLYSEAFGIETC